MCIRDRFEPAHPEKAIPLLAKARLLIAAMSDPLAKIKLAELDETLARCAGIWAEAQAAMVRKQIVQQRSEAAGARATTEQARGQLIEAQANRQDLVVRAPFSGVIVTRAAEPGEVVVAGTALVTMVDLSKVYLRGFVPEGQIGKVKLGQPVHVYLDSNTKQPIEAWVSRIDPQAMFTPENTYFQDERVKEVVGVKLQLKGAVGFAKPGMPADGEILTQGNTWPEASRRK